MTMTKIDGMKLDANDIRRMASGNETPAGVSLIEANLTENDMCVSVLRAISPLTNDEASYIMACVAVADCDADDWDAIPEHERVDYAYCDDASTAYRVAFSQLMQHACERWSIIRDAYDDATGQWAGCDWTTSHGPTEIDLDGENPRRLRELADKMEDGTITDAEYDELPQAASVHDMSLLPIDYDDVDEDRATKERIRYWIDDLRTGADWLDECAGAAAAAEEAAAQALDCVAAGDIEKALQFAEEACSCERFYGDDPTWHDFRRLIEEYSE